MQVELGVHWLELPDRRVTRFRFPRFTRAHAGDETGNNVKAVLIFDTIQIRGAKNGRMKCLLTG